jgi:AraC-like DNA-binding protein
MPKRPSVLLERPTFEDGRSVDVLSDVLRMTRLSTLISGRVELGTPWALRMAALPLFSFYVVARGGAMLTVEGDGSRHVATMSAGDVALLPRGGEHLLRDVSGRRLTAKDMGYRACTAGHSGSEPTTRFGGDGPVTELIAGGFRFDEPLGHPLLAALPRLLHMRADDPSATPWLSATVQLLVAESHAGRDGRSIVLERLAEVLLVQALRLRAGARPCDEAGLRALVDPAIGAALQRIHAAPGEPWTVERLASAVGLSRSGFAARFHELVGEPPLKYLTRWRVARAAELLRDGRETVAAVAGRMGYDSEAAFNRAFKRVHGLGPGKYRREQLHARSS